MVMSPENVLRRILTYQDIGGASERRITDAAKAIEHAAPAGEFTRIHNRVTDGPCGRWGEAGTIGLKIALNELVERRTLNLEVRVLEFFWKKKEE